MGYLKTAVCVSGLLLLGSPLAHSEPKAITGSVALDICMANDLAAAGKSVADLGWAATDPETVETLRAGYVWLAFKDDRMPKDTADASEVAETLSVRKNGTALSGEVTIVRVGHGWNCYVRGAPAEELTSEITRRFGAPSMDRAVSNASYKEWTKDNSSIGLTVYKSPSATRTLLTVNTTSQ